MNTSDLHASRLKETVLLVATANVCSLEADFISLSGEGDGEGERERGDGSDSE